MAFLELSNIHLAYGDRDILKDVTFSLHTGNRIGLAGINGSGKSTLMKIIAGISSPDSGRISKEKDIRISYLPQSGVSFSSSTLYGEAEKGFSRFIEIEEKKKAVEEQLSAASRDDPGIAKQLEEQHHLEEILVQGGYYHREIEIKKILSGLGFSMNELKKPCLSFSGGWQMRIALAKILLEKPDIMLLDEPTNYLDIEARSWLLSFLQEYRGALLLVSHDRYFLDQLIQKVAELYMSRLYIYHGNYSDYEKQRARAMETIVEEYKKQEREIKKIEDFIQRFRYNASKATLVQSRIKELEKIERIKIPANLKEMRFSFPPAPHSGKKVLRVENLNKSYGEKRVLSRLTLSIDRGEKIVLAGRNGAGKSTLLRILSGKDQDYQGTVEYGTGVKVGYFAQDIENSFTLSNSVLEEVENHTPGNLIPKIRNLLGSFLFSEDEVEKPVHVLSGGEKSRLALLLLLLRPSNLLLLDEPTNHLDITSKDILLNALSGYDGTCIFVSHDRYFTEQLARRVIEISPRGITDYPGNYSYFLEKRETFSRLNEETAPSETRNNQDKSHSQIFRERQKEFQRTQKNLLHREKTVMREIEGLENEHHMLQEKLSAPETYMDGGKVKEIKSALAENEKEQERLAEEWGKIEEELRSLD